MKLRNLTPHDLNIITSEGVITIKKEEGVSMPRLAETIEEVGSVIIEGSKIPIMNKVYGKCEFLPKPKKNIFLVVSSIIAQRLKRKDLLVPNTIREGGKIVGCNSFAQIL